MWFVLSSFSREACLLSCVNNGRELGRGEGLRGPTAGPRPPPCRPRPLLGLGELGRRGDPPRLRRSKEPSDKVAYGWPWPAWAYCIAQTTAGGSPHRPRLSASCASSAGSSPRDASTYLLRMHQFKEKSARERELVRTSLFLYRWARPALCPTHGASLASIGSPKEPRCTRSASATTTPRLGGGRNSIRLTSPTISGTPIGTFTQVLIPQTSPTRQGRR
jgi:hypothetical protein